MYESSKVSRTYSQVALLAEGVDRNSASMRRPSSSGSPSSRRAWIEIISLRSPTRTGPVALLAEGVDRNHPPPLRRPPPGGRPPRGGRG